MLERIKEIDEILNKWMKKKKIRCTYPEECMSVLVRYGVYYGTRGDALYFRNDLRDIREEFGLPYETEHLMIMQSNTQRWYIIIK